MARVLLIRPNDFIADAMVALLKQAGLGAVRVETPNQLQVVELDGVVGAVVSTAVTSSMPMTFAAAVASLRRRSLVPLVAATMLKDDRKALELLLAELTGEAIDLVPIFSTAQSLRHPELGSSRGVLLLRKDQVDAPEILTFELLQRHFGLRRVNQ